jgi:hypothetical protein
MQCARLSKTAGKYLNGVLKCKNVKISSQRSQT